MMLGVMLATCVTAAQAEAPQVHKSYVCKYVGTPGVDEVLQTGQNPIWVDNHSLGDHTATLTFVGEEFTDAQGRSIVIVANTAKLDPEPSVEDCPAVDVSPTPTPTETVTPTPTPTETTPPPTTPPPSTHSHTPTWTPTWTPTNGATPGEHPLASTGMTNGERAAAAAAAGLTGLGLGSLYLARRRAAE
jgi:hypothetical protein